MFTCNVINIITLLAGIAITGMKKLQTKRGQMPPLINNYH